MKKNNEKKTIKPISEKDFNYSLDKFQTFLKNEYFLIRKKSLKSKLIFISLNLITFVMSGLIVVLTSFIIGKKLGDDRIIWIFTALSIISASITFVVGLGSLFQFKKRKQVYEHRIITIEAIIKDLEEQEDLSNLNENIYESIKRIYQSDEEF